MLWSKILASCRCFKKSYELITNLQSHLLKYWFSSTSISRKLFTICHEWKDYCFFDIFTRLQFVNFINYSKYPPSPPNAQLPHSSLPEIYKKIFFHVIFLLKMLKSKIGWHILKRHNLFKNFGSFIIFFSSEEQKIESWEYGNFCLIKYRLPLKEPLTWHYIYYHL